MVNAKFGEESKESVVDEEEEDSDDDIEPIAEFRFVPSDKSACEYPVEHLIFSPFKYQAFFLSPAPVSHTHTPSSSFVVIVSCFSR